MTPVTVAKTSDMSKAEWLQWRKKGIGGSDVSAVLGINKWKSPFEVWNEKMDEFIPEEEDPSEAAYFGNVLESVVAEEFEKRTGKKVRRHNVMMAHPDRPYMLANIDRRIIGEDAILECKTANQYLAKEWEFDEVPSAYLVQLQHYLYVTGKQKAYIAVLIGGQRFIWKEIERDDELIDVIVRQVEAFWHKYVIPKEAPPLDGSSAAEKFLLEKYPQADQGESIMFGKSEKQLIEQLHETQESILKLKETETELKNKLKYHMQTAETAYVGEYEVSWKNVTSQRLDTKKLRREKPGLAEAYMTESISRRFTTKVLT